MHTYYRNAQYALSMAVYYASFCAMMVFSALYLRSVGLSASVIGMILGFAYLAGAVLQQVMTKVADRARILTIRELAMCQMAFGAVMLVPVLVVALPAWLIGGLFFVTATCQIACQSLLNAIAVSYTKRGLPVHFGIGRGMGSLGYAVTSIFLGRYLAGEAPIHVVWVLLFFLALATMLLGTLPKMPRLALFAPTDTASEAVLDTERSTQAFFRRYPLFFPLILGMTLLFVTHVIINNYMLFIMENAGGTAAHTGVATALAAGVEMLMLFSYLRWRKIFSERMLIGISVFAFTIKAMMLLFAQSPLGIYISQSLQFLSFGLLTPAMTYLAAQRVAPQDLVQGQVIVMIPPMLGGGLGGLFGGMLLDAGGVFWMLIWSTLISLVGTCICLWGLWKDRRGDYAQR